MVPLPGWRAINHLPVKLDDKFGIAKLFKPGIYHVKYHTADLYKDYNN